MDTFIQLFLILAPLIVLSFLGVVLTALLFVFFRFIRIKLIDFRTEIVKAKIRRVEREREGG
jgi:hypothetical protein